ncbi:membrane protein : [Gemmata massiliana]|uniref:Membrane protein n=1 Tax=Gemmata massiliana TaxID=1210884 RepID=A0A6P2CTC7_9BACT|nr:hypothetical protein [Gemmata massiliana]VTR92153.1 membrane protein : [Gemmata massiliana]
MITFTCSLCDQFINLPDRAAGKKTNCPLCNGIVVVPEESEYEEGEEVAPIPVVVSFGGGKLHWWYDWGIWVFLAALPCAGILLGPVKRLIGYLLGG